MPVDLTSQTVTIGVDAYGRPVSMTRRRTYDGRTMWRIESVPLSQRDDGERMDGLTDQNIEDMVAALDVIRKA